MNKLQLFYSVKPLQINQGFGLNPDYYAKFGIKAHNGWDFAASRGQPVYSPCDGMARYAFDSHGGDGIYIQTKEKFTSIKGNNYFWKIILWHLCSKDDPQYAPKIPTDGSWNEVKAGDLIAYADNTGAPFESSGDHLHFGLMPIWDNGEPVIPDNGFHGCVDPQPYFNGLFSEDILLAEKAVEIGREAVEITEADTNPRHRDVIMLLLQKISDLLKSLFQ